MASRRDEILHNPEASSRPKRRKIQVACRNCRSSKTRCDGATPVCVACEKRNLADSCVYERSQGPVRLHVSGWTNQAQRQERVQSADQETFTGPKRIIDQASSHSAHRFPLVNGSLSASKSARKNADQSLESNDCYPGDALATVHSGGGDDCLYGGSSTIAFVQQFAEDASAGDQAVAMRARDSLAPQTAAQLGSGTILSRPEIILERNESASVYPARRKANDFLHCFWEFIHPVFPVIHKTSFLVKYEKIWSGEDTDDHSDSKTDVEEVVFTSNLNLMFALGCQFSTLIPASQKQSAANEFYQRSRHLFLFDILDSKSISLVQMLLLTGIYLQSTPHATRCWNSIGLAIRLAQSLGLHLDHVGRRPESQLTCQMRRRVWHTCVILDRLTAMTFGRPTMLTSCGNVPIPLLVDDEYLSVQGTGAQPSDVPSRLGLFISSCKLFEILHDILSNFYTEDSGSGLSKQLTSDGDARHILMDVLNYNRRLDRFNDSVPEYLRTNRSFQIVVSEKNSCVNLQQQVLYCRFLYTKLLSLRPLLLLATKSEQQTPSQTSMSKKLSSSLDEELIRCCCNTCVTTAHSLVETIHQHLDTAYKSSGWHSVYFTFAAATILLAALKCQDIDLELRDTSFEICWTQCLSILNHYKEQIHSASRAIQVLQTLRSQVIATQHQHTVVGNDSVEQAPVHFDPSLQIDFSNFNPYGADCITDAWFGQQIFNLDWMDFPSLQ